MKGPRRGPVPIHEDGPWRVERLKQAIKRRLPIGHRDQLNAHARAGQIPRQAGERRQFATAGRAPGGKEMHHDQPLGAGRADQLGSGWTGHT